MADIKNVYNSAKGKYSKKIVRVPIIIAFFEE